MNIKKERNKTKRINIIFKHKRPISIYLNIICVLLILPIFLSKRNNSLRKFSLDNEITITIKGNGTKYIIEQWSAPTPNEVYVNGKQVTASKQIDFVEQENIVRMIFNSPINSCKKLFFSLTDIVKIDLSKFDTSAVTEMDGMFKGCSSLTSIEIGNLDTSSLASMMETFYGCSSLTSVDLSGLDVSRVTIMQNMFYENYALKSVNLDNFNTSNVSSMKCMFYHCESLETLDLKDFITSNVTDMSNMFEQCKSLFSLNIDNFDTSNVVTMGNMFYGCSSLISLNLGNFETSKVNNSNNMLVAISPGLVFCFNETKTFNISTAIKSFNNSCEDVCFLENHKLLVENSQCLKSCQDDQTYIYEYNNICYNSCPENTKLIDEIKKCIDNCTNDEIYQFEYDNQCYQTCPKDLHVSYDNLYLCIEQPEGYYLDGNIYKPCYSLCKSCDEEGNETKHNCIECKETYTKLNDSLIENNCYEICETYYFDFSNEYHCYECTEEKSKYIKEKDECIDDCSNDSIYKYEYNNICYETCPEGFHPKIDNNYSCFKDPENYYLDGDIYKSCYSTCKSCNGKGNETNNNCEECISGYIFINEVGVEKNCYPQCDNYFYFDLDGNYNCTENKECPEIQNKLIENKNKCIDDCSKDDVYIYEQNNMCVEIIINEDDGTILICPLNLPYEKSKKCVENCTAVEFLTKECKINNKKSQEAKNDIIKRIKTELSNGNLDSLLSNVIKGDKQDYIVSDTDAVYQITSSDNQNNIEYNNLSSILLGDCEEKLKAHYNIDKDEALIIFKMDIFEEGLKIPIIEYEIYNPETLQKLELDCCKDTKIGVSIPVSIDETSLYKYNSSDDYYNDICYSYTTENGTDIVVKDRQNEFVENNMSLCESSCEYTYYNSTNKKVLCECEPKNEISDVSQNTDTKDKLLNAFSDLKNAINLEIMKCYKKLFTKDGLIKNIGSYILLVIIIIYIISVFLFVIKGYSLIVDTIRNLVKNKNIEEQYQKNDSKKSSTNIFKGKKKKN